MPDWLKYPFARQSEANRVSDIDDRNTVIEVQNALLVPDDTAINTELKPQVQMPVGGMGLKLRKAFGNQLVD